MSSSSPPAPASAISSSPSGRPLKIDIHTHILPRDWPNLKEKYGFVIAASSAPLTHAPLTRSLAPALVAATADSFSWNTTDRALQK